MLISNCPLDPILGAIRQLNLGYNLTSLSPLRHRLKLFPPLEKPYRVQAGHKIRYSHTLAQRELAREAYSTIVGNLRWHDPLDWPEEAPKMDNPPTLDQAYYVHAYRLAQIIRGKESPRYLYVSKYQRKSPTGERPIRALCWHGFRDFFKILFKLHPDAKIRTSITTYMGLSDFKAKYPDTAYHQIGSNMAPLLLAEACFCDKATPR